MTHTEIMITQVCQGILAFFGKRRAQKWHRLTYPNKVSEAIFFFLITKRGKHTFKTGMAVFLIIVSHDSIVKMWSINNFS